jgi:hypothetical protein
MAANVFAEVANTTSVQSEPASQALLRAATRWRWPIWIAATLLIYYPIFQTRPIFDDTAHVEFAARQGWQLLHMGPFFFRPFERALIGVNWMLSGDNFWLVRLVALIIFILKVSLVYDLAARIVPTRRAWAPWVIALVFLLHPMNVCAVGKIDTFSEDIAALFALLTVRLAIVAACSRDAAPAKVGRNALLAAAMVFAGMLSKEAFAGIAAATPVLFAVAIGASGRESRRALVYLVALITVAALGYFAARHAFGFPPTGALTTAARYQLHVGSNVLVNLAAELASITFPGSTLALFVKFNAVHVVISSGLVIAFLVLFRKRLVAMTAGYGGLPAEQRRLILIVLIAALSAMFPTCLISQVISENQTALALPFVLLLALACPLGVRLEPACAGSYTASLVCCLSAIALVWMAGATVDKVLAARDASEHAYRIGDLILTKYYEHPTSAVTVCFERSMQTEPKKYSIFSMPDDLAAFFQLYRLRVSVPAPVMDIVDLRLKNPGIHAHCSLSISGASVARQ